MQAVQEAQQAGDITAEQADAAKERYAAIHRHFVQAMAKEKQLIDEAKQLNEELLVRASLRQMACVFTVRLDKYSKAASSVFVTSTSPA